MAVCLLAAPLLSSALSSPPRETRPKTIYGLRHAHATLALSAGVNPKIVSEQLGHSSISVTMDILPGMQEETALAVEQLLDRPASG